MAILMTASRLLQHGLLEAAAAVDVFLRCSPRQTGALSALLTRKDGDESLVKADFDGAEPQPRVSYTVPRAS